MNKLVRQNLSLEFFPPSDENKKKLLLNNIHVLNKLNLNFISVTYGAGGSTRDRTHDLIIKLKGALNCEVVPHLTIVNETKEKLIDLLKQYFRYGIKNIVILRGDHPNGKFEVFKNGFSETSELIYSAKEIGFKKIFVSGYPEIHPESTGFKEDIGILKNKIKKGANGLITQFTLADEKMSTYHKLLISNKINIDFIPGVIIFTKLNGILKMAQKCNIYIPDELLNYKNLPVKLISKNLMEFNLNQIKKILKNYKRCHIFTLNNIKLLLNILERIDG